MATMLTVIIEKMHFKLFSYVKVSRCTIICHFSQTLTHAFPAYIALTEKQHLKICSYIKQLENVDIIRLGQALGLLRSNLKKINVLPDHMIDAWLNRSDHVLETSGPPTWESLCQGLRQIDQNGLAIEVERKGMLLLLRLSIS